MRKQPKQQRAKIIVDDILQATQQCIAEYALEVFQKGNSLWDLVKKNPFYHQSAPHPIQPETRMQIRQSKIVLITGRTAVSSQRQAFSL